MESTASECFRAVRTCDAVLAALEGYPERDGAIVRLELAIMDERLEALLGARENIDVADEQPSSPPADRLRAFR
jgi:hypothetical protein